MKEIPFDEWFKSSEDEVIFGTELELIMFDSRAKRLVRDRGRVDDIFRDMPKQIFRDYYPWQLELKTSPTNDIDKAIDETLKYYREIANELFDRERIIIVPMPRIFNESNNNMESHAYCGLHIHFSYPEISENSYWNKAMGMYPFVLSITDHTKNYEVDEVTTSERFLRSRHIGLPYLMKRDFMNIGGRSHQDHKFRDLIYSPSNPGEERQRMSKPDTIEFRLFDTPSQLSMYRFILETVVNIARKMRVNNPMVEMINNDVHQAQQKLGLTRRLVEIQRYGINKIFEMSNSNVNRELCEELGIKYPEETQFEYRDRNSISQNVNGFISMATSGGWL